MKISFSHIRIGSANVAVFEADAQSRTQHSRDQLLAELTAEARGNNLRVDRAALAFVQNGRMTFFGDRDLVKVLSSGQVHLPRNYSLSR